MNLRSLHFEMNGISKEHSPSVTGFRPNGLYQLCWGWKKSDNRCSGKIWRKSTFFLSFDRSWRHKFWHLAKRLFSWNCRRNFENNFFFRKNNLTIVFKSKDSWNNDIYMRKNRSKLKKKPYSPARFSRRLHRSDICC